MRSPESKPALTSVSLRFAIPRYPRGFGLEKMLSRRDGTHRANTELNKIARSVTAMVNRMVRMLVSTGSSSSTTQNLLLERDCFADYLE